MFAWLHAASGLSCLHSCRTSQRITSKQQLPAADDGVVVVGGLFANSFLSKISMLSMLYWESGSDDHISVCNYSWFMITVLAPCPHQLQTHTVQFCFYPFPVGGGWLLCDFGSHCPGRYYLLSTHIEFSQIFETLQIQIVFGALKLFRNSKCHNSE